MGNVVLIILWSWFVGMLGFAFGTEEGRMQMHLKEYECITLPDNRVECFKVKQEK